MAHDPAYEIQAIELQASIMTLEQNTGLSLPNYTNCDKLKNMANLFIQYTDIIGTENGEKGTVIKPFRIPTNGQSHNQKQHQISKALKAGAEIARIATDGNY